MPPLKESDLIFPSASKSLSTTLYSLKRTNLSITNRLHSIATDAEFVSDVAHTLGLPLVANERCGSWYIRPDEKAGSAYFKSTDGHFGQWAFSLRRLNLGVLRVVGERGGCVIIDSTRRGKSMPDALAKTIGIWIAVLNRLLFPELTESRRLLTPKEVVSESEHAQIDERIEGFVRDVRGLELDIEGLRAKLKKPMRPVWVTPATDLSALAKPELNNDFATVVLCTASSRSSEGMRDDPGYVQGAADDSEAWACGLDAVTFWDHGEELLASTEDDLPELIASLVASTSNSSRSRPATKITPPGSIWIGENAIVGSLAPSFDVILHCGPTLDEDVQQSIGSDGRVLIQLPCTSGKNGSRQLRACLPELEKLCAVVKADPKILITSHDGKDLAVGVALCLICMFCSEDGTVNLSVRREAPNKAEIKKRLSWILVSMSEASPSRATLQSVNSYLMG